MATHSSILAWRIPWTEGSWGCRESDTTEQLTSFFCLFLVFFVCFNNIYIFVNQITSLKSNTNSCFSLSTFPSRGKISGQMGGG